MVDDVVVAAGMSLFPMTISSWNNSAADDDDVDDDVMGVGCCCRMTCEM